MDYSKLKQLQNHLSISKSKNQTLIEMQELNEQIEQTAFFRRNTNLVKINPGYEKSKSSWNVHQL
jgi:hypothetical protein